MSAPSIEIELVPLCRLTAWLGVRHVVGEGPAGTRVVVSVDRAVAEGERLRAEAVGVAADWLIVGAGGVGTVDVRMTLRTHDGALVYLRYEGRSARPGRAPNHVAPLFETGDERYAWLNQVLGVGKGVVDGDTVTYDIYEVR